MSLPVSRKFFAAALAAMCAAVMIFAPGGSAALVKPNPSWRATAICGSPARRRSPRRVLLERVWPAPITTSSSCRVTRSFCSDLLLGYDIGHFNTKNTRATVTKTLPNGTTTTGACARSAPTKRPVAWSDHVHVQPWTGTISPNRSRPRTAGTLTYPEPAAARLVRGQRRQAVPADGLDLARPVEPSAGFPVTTSATQYSPPNRLAAGDYYWGGDPDRRARASTGNPSPSALHLELARDQHRALGDRSRPSAPRCSTRSSRGRRFPAPSSYQIEINHRRPELELGQQGLLQTPTASRPRTRRPRCCPPDTYYWRVRAKDSERQLRRLGRRARQQLGSRSRSRSTTTCRASESHHGSTRIRRRRPGRPGSRTDTPIVTWNPTPGAASYDVDVVPYDGITAASSRLRRSGRVAQSRPPTTAWTPLGSGFNVSNPFPNTGHPGVSATQLVARRASQLLRACPRPRDTRTARTTSSTGAYTQLGGSATIRRSPSRAIPTGSPAPLRATGDQHRRGRLRAAARDGQHATAGVHAGSRSRATQSYCRDRGH